MHKVNPHRGVSIGGKRSWPYYYPFAHFYQMMLGDVPHKLNIDLS